MTPEDLSRLHRAAFPDGRGWTAEEFAALAEHPARLLFTHPPHGLAVVQCLPPEMEILTIAVAPEAQGQGIGAALLSDLLAAARARGVAQVFLDVAADNTAARALYAKAGFAETGRRRGYYRRAGGAAQDAVLMTRTLPARETGIAAPDRA